MMEYQVRKARMEDLPTILRLRDEARSIMRKNGNMQQWPEGYPLDETFIKDIECGHSYMMETDGEAAATFAFIPCPEPTYAKIYEGEWFQEDRPYYVIHRIASTAASCGVMKTLLDYCFQQTDNIRIDTHRDNKIMRNSLQKNGFRYCGIIYLANGDERLAFQRIVEND